MLMPVFCLYAVAFATAVAMILEGLAPLWSRTFQRWMASASTAHQDRGRLS